MIPMLIKLAVAALLALFIVLLLTPPVAKMLIHFGIVDKPSARRINKTPIPRGGGIALILGVVLSLLIFELLIGIDFNLPVCRNGYTLIYIALAILILIGLVDDIFELRPVFKLIGQIIVAVIVYSTGISIGGIMPFEVPESVNCFFTVIWFVGIINAFNLIDGLDGLATGLALIGALGLSICLIIRGNYEAVFPLAALIGACIGFLRFNFNPASIFLGDTGSMFLGFVLALVPLAAGGKAALVASLGVPLLVIGVPIFDTILAIWRRTFKATMTSSGGLKQVFSPDMEHLHHRLLASGFGQRRVACFLYGLAIVMVSMAIAITVRSHHTSGIILIGAIIIFGIVGGQLSRVELWYTGNVLRKSFGPKTQRLLVPMYVLCDIGAIFFAWWLAGHLAMIPHVRIETRLYYTIFPIFFSAIFGMMWAFRIYHRIWGRALVRDFLILQLAIILGWLIAYSISTLAFDRYPGFWRHAVVFLLIALPLLISVRILRSTGRNLLITGETSRIMNEKESERLVVYGAGERFAMFDLMQSGSQLGCRNYCIVGLVDDDPVKYHRVINDYSIYGGIDELEKVVKEKGATAILVAATLPEDCFKRMIDIATKNGLKVLDFNFDLRHILVEEKLPIEK